MNSLAFVAFFAVLATSYSAPSATIVQGPSARATVVGSDGSVISSVSPGAQIVAEEHPGVIAHAAPVHHAPAVVSTYSAPAVLSYAHPAPAVVSSYAHSAPAVVSTYSHSAPVVAAHAPVVAYSAPVLGAHSLGAHTQVDTVVAGPSGTIATSKTVAAPAVVAAAPVIAGHGVHAYAAHGHGLYY
ncbi:unnamed protein product [Phyllotreta striolata]|uniref:Uncharacterized protein n=1 Tax=Phyllotreta striolata TaxID=444603 RepID=A0A9N9TVT8_PHYSR|nr:unnamed protein product [Phyllotreta striolata]